MCRHIINTHAVVRTQEGPVCLCQLSLTACKTIVWYHSQDIDIGTVRTQNIFAAGIPVLPFLSWISCPPSLLPVTLSSSLAITHLVSVPTLLSFQEGRINGILQHLIYWDWLFLLSIIPSRSIQGAGFIHSPFYYRFHSVSVPQSRYHH